MGKRGTIQPIYIDAESDKDSSWPDGTQVFCKDTSNLYILNNGAFIGISSGATGGGEINTASNVGSGNAIFKAKSGYDLQFRTLSAGTGISIVTGDTITISSSTATTVDGWTTIVKSVNQDVTNTATTNDDEFFFSVTAGNSYLVDMTNAVSANDGTGQARGVFGVDSGIMSGAGSFAGYIFAAISSNGLASSAVFQMTNLGTGINIDWVTCNRVTFSFTPSASTTFRFKFGNFSVGVGRTSRMWKGSIMKYKNLN